MDDATVATPTFNIDSLYRDVGQLTGERDPMFPMYIAGTCNQALIEDVGNVVQEVTSHTDSIYLPSTSTSTQQHQPPQCRRAPQTTVSNMNDPRQEMYPLGTFNKYLPVISNDLGSTEDTGTKFGLCNDSNDECLFSTINDCPDLISSEYTLQEPMISFHEDDSQENTSISASDISEFLDRIYAEEATQIPTGRYPQDLFDSVTDQLPKDINILSFVTGTQEVQESPNYGDAELMPEQAMPTVPQAEPMPVATQEKKKRGRGRPPKNAQSEPKTAGPQENRFSPYKNASTRQDRKSKIEALHGITRSSSNGLSSSGSDSGFSDPEDTYDRRIVTNENKIQRSEDGPDYEDGTQSSSSHGETPDTQSDIDHLERRQRNNEASRRSRNRRKVQEQLLEQEKEQLEKKHKKLKSKLETLKKYNNIVVMECITSNVANRSSDSSKEPAS